MTMHGNIGINHHVINKKSSISSHRRLCHISIQRIKRLVNDGVLQSLDLLILVLMWIALKESRLTKPMRVSGC